ncbi:MAG TPA: DUF2232 domain-containing protein [bacterium]|nr:DUF2232 domain-containing protein [bacterium]
MFEFYFYVFVYLLTGMFPGLNFIGGYITYKIIYKSGIKKAALFVAFVSAIIFLLTDFGLIGALSALFGAGSLLMVAFAGSAGFNKRIIIIPLILFFIIAIFKYEIIFNAADSLSGSVLKHYEANKDVVNKQIRSIVSKPDSIIDAEDFFKSNLKLFVKIFPGILCGYIFAGVIMNCYLLKFFLNKNSRLKTEVAKNDFIQAPDFSGFYFNDNIIWIFILSFAGMLFAKKIEPAHTVCFNIIIAAFVVYYFQGVFIASYYLKKINFYLPLTVLILLPLFFMTSVVGISDIWFDYRKIRNIKNKNINRIDIIG